MIRTIELKTKTRDEFIDITDSIRAAVKESAVTEGLCTVFIPHTTAGVTINEGADPAVRRDMLAAFRRVFPEHGDYRHDEGNSDAHIKATLAGSSVNIIIENSRPLLGTWQSVYFCEFDGPRNRQFIVRIA